MNKTRLFKGLTAVSSCALALSVSMTMLCNDWAGHINVALNIRPPVEQGNADTTYYKTAYSEDGTLSDESLKKMLEASDKHDVQTMEEGAVLLKNEDSALPLKSDERRVTLFGRSSADPVYRGNSGGAGRDANRLVSLYSALKAENFAINETLFNAYKNSPTKRGKGEGLWNIGEENSSFYTAELRGSYATDYKDVAIITFSRDGGEGNDLPRDYKGKSFLALQDEEKDLLQLVAAGGFGKIIVLINSAYPMELGWLEKAEYGVDAALWIGGTGLKGFTGVANLLVGKADPSGHFVDTYAADSLSAPAVRNFGNYTFANANAITSDSSTHYIVEAEGIYQGYKYYETRYQDCVLGVNNADGKAGVYASSDGWNYAEEIVYPFGYGSSYAAFTQTLENLEWDRTEHTLTATVKVVNNGVPESSAYSGKSKSVVQLYVQLPWQTGQAEKSAIQLVDFGKTAALGAGEEDTVTITVDDYIFATYDENAANGADTSKKGCYVFDEGDYYFSVGNNAHDALNNVLAARGVSGGYDRNGNAAAGDAAKTRTVTLDALDNVTHARSAETGEIVCNKVQYADINYYGNGTEIVKYLTRGDWNTYPQPYVSITATAQMIEDLKPDNYVKDASAPAYDSSKIGIKKGINFIQMKDVPFTGKFVDKNGVERDADKLWDEFLRQMSLSELCSIIGEAFGQPLIKTINKNVNVNSDGPSGPQGSYQFGDKGAATQRVNEVVAASTWNKEILRDRGSFIGEDCLYVGTTQLWSPGADLHRTPFSGRNYEYYSEDSVMSYHCGAIQVAAMQAKGVNTAIKHFCGNDQETNRTGLATFMTEQAYRQGPLKGFEGAFTKGGCLSTMTSMNRVGCSIMYEDYATLTLILRGEWGFKGVNITDSAISQKCFGTIASIMAGTDTFNADAGRAGQVSSHIVANRDGAVLDRVFEINKRFYYSFARSNNINGLSENTEVKDFVPWWQPALIAVCSVLGVATAVCAVVYVLNAFVIKKKGERDDA